MLLSIIPARNADIRSKESTFLNRCEILSHFTLADGILIVFVIVAIIVSSIFVYKNGAESEYAIIEYNGQTENISLNKDQMISLENGMMIEVKDRRIRVKDSDCPQKICVKHGWIRYGNDVIVCLPNKTIIYLKKKSDLDYITR
ncbi:NusG domain II-containing protein [bacterium]|nr:MAG: NusG domain II-containing protein [bacterium]